MVRIVRSDTIAARHDVVGGRHVVASLSGEPGVQYNDIRELKAHGELSQVSTVDNRGDLTNPPVRERLTPALAKRATTLTSRPITAGTLLVGHIGSGERNPQPSPILLGGTMLRDPQPQFAGQLHITAPEQAVNHRGVQQVGIVNLSQPNWPM